MYIIGMLSEHGYIQVSTDNVAWNVVHDAQIPRPIPLKHYPSIPKAKAELPPNPDAIIMRVRNRVITDIYFTEEQMEMGFYDLRLNRFPRGYETIKLRTR